MNHDKKKTAAPSSADVEIDFFALLRYAVGGWRVILVCVFVSMAVTACNLRTATSIYEANMIVAPVMNSDSGNSNAQSLTSKVLSTLGGGGGGMSSQFDQFQYKLTSPSVVHAANRDGKLYEWVYPGLWDSQTRSWTKPGGMKQFLVGSVRAFFGRPEWIVPDDVITSETLKNQVVFEIVPKSTLTRVSYQNSDPKVATEMLRRLFTEADRQLRDAERVRLKTQIANANAVLATTQVADFRQAMAQAMANAQFRMLNVPDGLDYSASKVEAPFVSSLPVSPRITLSLAMAFLAAFLLSTFAVVAYQVAIVELRRRGRAVPPATEMAGYLMGRLRGRKQITR